MEKQTLTINPVGEADIAGPDHPSDETGTAPLPQTDPLRAADRPLSDAARRALMEAAERRAAAGEADLPAEHGGPRGPEPTRYGDWEKKGLAVDF